MHDGVSDKWFPTAHISCITTAQCPIKTKPNAHLLKSRLLMTRLVFEAASQFVGADFDHPCDSMPRAVEQGKQQG